MPVGVKARHLLASTLVLALAAPSMLAGCGSDDTAGALESSEWPATITIGHPADVGTAVGIGGPMMLVNDSEGAVEVESVELLQPAAGVSLVGWVLRDVDADTPATGTLESFPPSDSRPEVERTIGPTGRENDDGYLIGDTELVIGLQADAPGVHTSSMVRVTYLDDDSTRTVDFPLVVVLCAPRADYPQGCGPG